MLRPTVYIVEPKPLLLEMSFPATDVDSIVADTGAWQNEEGNSELLPRAREIIAKEVILAYFLSFDEFDEMLGHPPVSEETFDKFWTLRRLCLDGNLSHLKRYASRVDPSRFESTGDERLDSIIARHVGHEDY